MTLNTKDKTRLQKTYADMKMTLLQGTLVTLGAGRPASAQEGNYKEICSDLVRFGMKNTEVEVNEAAAIMAAALGRPVEVLKPADDNGAASKLAVLQGASSSVQ